MYIPPSSDLFNKTKEGGIYISLSTHNLIYTGEEENNIDAYYKEKHKQLSTISKKYNKIGNSGYKNYANPEVNFDPTSRQRQSFLGILARKLVKNVLGSVEIRIREAIPGPGLPDGPNNIYLQDPIHITLLKFVQGLSPNIYDDIEKAITRNGNELTNRGLDAGLDALENLF